MVKHGTMRYNVVHRGTLWYTKKIEYGTIWHNMAQYGTIWHNMAQDGTRWHKMAQDGARWRKIGQDGAIHHLASPVQSSTLDFHYLSHYSYIKAIMLYKSNHWTRCAGFMDASWVRLGITNDGLGTSWALPGDNLGMTWG